MILFFLCILNLAFAQQNFFNVPNSEITTHGHSFFQEQINLDGDTVSLNSTYDYGLGHEWEVGFNLLGINIDGRKGNLTHNYNFFEAPLYPALLVNSQKGFVITKNIHWSFGGQYGSTLDFHKQQQSLYYYYTNLEFKADNSELLAIIGVYNANHQYRGRGHGWLQLGLEFPLIEERLHVVSDFSSGDSKISMGVFGLCYFFKKNIALSGGYQIPAPNSDADHAAIFEFTMLPEGDLTQGKI